MHDPIEGQFRVLGEKPQHEPAIKNEGRTLLFLAFLLAAIAFKTWQNSEARPGESLDRSVDATTAEQSARATIPRQPLD